MGLDAGRVACIVGCGDIGQRLAGLLRAQGLRVRAVVRSASSAAALAAAGIAARAIDLDAEGPVPSLCDEPVGFLFWFAPPPGAGITDPRIRRGLEALTPAPRRLVYLSTSGVYGDCAGRWIDEDAPLLPQSDRARRRVDAESTVREYARRDGSESLILRVPGIYGPGRWPLARLREGRPVLRREDAPFSNRIHANDLATAALAVAARGAPGMAYNVSDGSPTTMTDYFLRCAELLGLPAPPQLDAAAARHELSPSLLSFLDESKRLDTRRLRELGWSPRHADLASGLRASLEEGGEPLESPG